MIETVPFFSDPIWSTSMTFEGTTFGMYFAYNQRCASWYMSIADQDGVDIYNGVKLVTGFALLAKCRDPRRPAGDFVVFSSTSDLSPPQLTELAPGGRCTLYYITSDWIALMAAPGGFDTVMALVAAGQTSGGGLSGYGQG